MATRIVVMKNGLIQQIGTPKEIYTKPANIFVGKFIGSPAMNFIDLTINGNDFTFGNTKLDVPESVRGRLAAEGYVHKELVMGIRPENIEVINENEQNSNTFTFNVEVDNAELMGSETLVYFKLDEQILISKINSMEDFYAGQNITLGINYDHIHFFDKETELRIPMKNEVNTKAEAVAI